MRSEEKQKKRHRKYSKELRTENREWLRQYKIKNGCRMCGIKDPAVLEMHHSTPHLGDLNRPAKISTGSSAFQKAVKECILLCANCHARVETCARTSSGTFWIVDTLSPEKMYYETLGDWVPVHERGFWIGVVEGPPAYTLAIALHEMLEAFMCVREGVSEKDVTAFDKAHPECDDPGEEKDAPYSNQHIAATVLERAALCMMNQDWPAYLAWSEEAWEKVVAAQAKNKS